MERFRSTASLLVTVAITALLAIACDSGTQEPDAPTPDMPESMAATDSAADAGEAAAGSAREGKIDSSRFPTEMPEGATAEIPSNFPSDVPVYPGAQPAMGRGVEVDGSPMSAVQLLTNDSAGDVSDFYLENLESQGWTVDSQPAGGGTAINATKGDSCRTSVMVQPAAGGGTDIFVVTEC